MFTRAHCPSPKEKRVAIVLAGSFFLAGVVLSLTHGPATAQQAAPPKDTKSQPSATTTIAALDAMTAAGKSRDQLAQHVFGTHGCSNCHTVGRDGKLGFTERGKQTGQGFEGCISLLTAMTVIVQVDEDERSQQQREKGARFKEFGCAFCHKVSPGELALTEVGSKLAHLHLGCVDTQKLVAGGAAPKR
jgi:cytochrome c2